SSRTPARRSRSQETVRADPSQTSPRAYHPSTAVGRLSRNALLRMPRLAKRSGERGFRARLQFRFVMVRKPQAAERGHDAEPKADRRHRPFDGREALTEEV